MSPEGLDDVGGAALERRARWELEERLADLEAEVAERAAREQQREAEIAALRHELELRATLDASREERIALAESRLELLHGDLRWLRAHTDAVTAQFGEERAALQAAAAAAAEVRRVAHEQERSADRAALSSARARVNDLEEALRRTEQALAEERARLSYRVVQRVTSGPLARRAIAARHRDP